MPRSIRGLSHLMNMILPFMALGTLCAIMLAVPKMKRWWVLLAVDTVILVAVAVVVFWRNWEQSFGGQVGIYSFLFGTLLLIFPDESRKHRERTAELCRRWQLSQPLGQGQQGGPAACPIAPGSPSSISSRRRVPGN